MAVVRAPEEAGYTSQDRTVQLAGSRAAGLLGTAAWSSSPAVSWAVLVPLSHGPQVPLPKGRVHDRGRCAEVAVSPPCCIVAGAERGAWQPCEVSGAQQPLRSMLVAPLCSGAPGQQLSSPSVALCHLQPGASRPRGFLWQGCGVSAGPRPWVCVRARYFLPAPWGQGPFVSSLTTACHRAGCSASPAQARLPAPKRSIQR